MSFDLLTLLYTIFIQPLQFVFEVIFSVANKLTNHPGLSIVVLSLMMNFLVLPLYKRADDMQEKQRQKEAKLKKGMDHINKVFHGDERMMILQTFYRQNNYKPTEALNGSISLLLEVPFFIAAYQFLSHLVLLEGVSLGPISNLGQPDAMLVLGGLSINVLPFLMTFINIISSAIYLKGFPLKTKIQLYAMAAFFLVFLYDSPSGLVFYWTLNNVFSLFKNIFYKLKNPKKVLVTLSSLLGVIILGFVFFIYETDSIKRKVFLMAAGILLQLPFLLTKIKWKNKDISESHSKSKYLHVLLAGLVISVFVGAHIPSSVIASSPEEFMSVVYFHHPINYIIYSLCMALGFFVVWVGVFYWIASERYKVIIEKVMIVLSVLFIINFMFFGTDLGTLFPNLKYQSEMIFSSREMIVNLVVMGVLGMLVVLFTDKLTKHVPSLLGIMVVAFAITSTLNITGINTAAKDYQTKTEEIEAQMPHFNLSKEGKNVIVLLLDRAMNSHVPYIFNEKPELKQQFDGFTHYTNTVSFGGFTNFGTSPVFAGYEYTPLEMNKRENELLVDKHNESLKVLPVLYSQNDYDVTVFDPSYANYTWIPDISIYDDYPEINVYITEGTFNNLDMENANVENNYRNFFCFGLMKSLPVCLQEPLYDYGYYHKLASNKTMSENNVVYNGQKATSITQAQGINHTFMKSYNVLLNMNNLTHIQEGDSNHFVMMTNNTTHEPMLLQMPDYTPSMEVDNTDYFEAVKDKYIMDGNTLVMENYEQVSHYHVNMATFMQLGKWFDYLRENDVYDNTKIILVSDHGRPLFQVEDMVHDQEDAYKNAEFYYPLLMVKDFNSEGFTTSNEFMTNGDVPTIALEDTISHPINPFTGNKINNDAKYEEPIYVIRSSKYQTTINNGYTFLPAQWAIVKEDVMDENNWTYIDEECVDPRK